ncbi:hypothetical protein E2562_011927 [Oryza meyeriana var. granulata]|uniref:Uncharacterized protein n=1 Tax=Oryza meyeriana var. granulata TaxID=110450 RepID=A0A6G1CFC7_9ORYZ|nr:hypothetical protein E2562_011927 [Oryza meyeriana var. granulata]
MSSGNIQKRKPRRNTTKYGKNPDPQVSSPQRPSRETIIQESPIRVTRSRLAMLMGEGTSSQPVGLIEVCGLLTVGRLPGWYVQGRFDNSV